jgi:iron(III) transport system substrate-binding protein
MHRWMQRSRPWWIASTITVLCLSVLPGCSGAGGNTITLYNGQHVQLADALVNAFERETGIHVQVRSNDGIVLADQILEEGSGSLADVYLTENSPELMMLSEHHLLARLPASITDEVPSQYNSPTRNWVGVALRVSALAYNSSRLPVGQLPATILDLGQPEWKGKVAIAPTDSDFVPLVGAVLAEYGKQTALGWLRGLKANADIYQDDEAVVSAVNSGRVGAGVINQYYWYRLRLELGSGNIKSKLYYFPNRDVGAIENVSGAAVLASSHHQVNADKFVQFLVSPTAQRILAGGDDFEYPARPGVGRNPALPPLSEVNPAVLSVVKLGDDQLASKLLQSSGLT